MKKLDLYFLILLIFIPVTLVADWVGVSPVYLFFVSALAIIPLAKYIGEATEELATHSNPAMGGFLNATFGNATELIIGIFSLRAGLIEVVKASITGSILGNLLLVLGMAMFFGGRRHKKQEFNKTAASASASTLILTMIAFVIPAIFLTTDPGISDIVVGKLSISVSILMIIIYFSSLLFSLYSHKHLYTEEVGKYEPKWSISKSTIILILATLGVATMSEILVSSINPIVTSLGWSPLFIGVIFVALIGNVAEHVSAITVAMKNRMDLAIQITIGSATQIAMLVAPLLVI